VLSAWLLSSTRRIHFCRGQSRSAGNQGATGAPHDAVESARSGECITSGVRQTIVSREHAASSHFKVHCTFLL
jgi:hypothetical protein